jgi:hypothetical protein
MQGSFEVSNAYDREFNRMAQTFGMTAKYARLKGKTDHNVLPTLVDPCQIRLSTQPKTQRKSRSTLQTQTKLPP